MSAVTDQLDNIIASLTNVNASLKAEESQTTVAPDVPAPAESAPETPTTPEVPAETDQVESTEEASEPADATVAPNTPSAQG